MYKRLDSREWLWQSEGQEFRLKLMVHRERVRRQYQYTLDACYREAKEGCKPVNSGYTIQMPGSAQAGRAFAFLETFCDQTPLTAERAKELFSLPAVIPFGWTPLAFTEAGVDDVLAKN